MKKTLTYPYPWPDEQEMTVEEWLSKLPEPYKSAALKGRANSIDGTVYREGQLVSNIMDAIWHFNWSIDMSPLNVPLRWKDLYTVIEQDLPFECESKANARIPRIYKETA